VRMTTSWSFRATTVAMAVPKDPDPNTTTFIVVERVSVSRV
jgi:hypothetical protein